jgi:hypothetical protein
VADWWLTVVELVVEKLVMRVVVAEAAERERERGGETAETRAMGADFFQTLDPNFSSLEPSTQPLFISGGIG